LPGLRTRNVGLIIVESQPDSYADPLYSTLIREFSREVQQRECNPILIHLPWDTGEDALPFALRNNRLDGYILTGVLTGENLRLFRSLGVPFVIFGLYDVGPDMAVVTPDIYNCAVQGMNHLFSLGHEKIGLLTGPREYYYNQEIMRGYLEAYRKRGLDWKEEWTHESLEIWGTGRKPAEAILRCADVPTALFVTDHRCACGVVDTLASRGIRAGDDMSVLTLSGVEQPDFRPRLTRIKNIGNMDETGRLLVKLLWSRMADPEQPAVKTIVPHAFEEGETCGPVKTREAP